MSRRQTCKVIGNEWSKANSWKGRRKTRKRKQGGLSVVPVLTKSLTRLRHVIPIDVDAK